MIPVIDISKWQGTIDFTVMTANHVAGVIIRASNGTTPDLTCDRNVAGARNAGLPVGVYAFMNPKQGTARQQGELLADIHLRHGCELPAMLDVENYDGQPGNGPPLYGPRFAAWLREVVATVTELTGREPIIYTNAAYWNPHVGATDFGHLDLICARYPFYSPSACAANVPPLDARDWDDWIFSATTKRPQVPRGWSTWQGWQFSAGWNGRGHAYGCGSTDLDLNVIRDDVWQRWTGTAPQPPPDPLEADVPAVDHPIRQYDSRTAGGALQAGEVRTVNFMANTVTVNITVAEPADAGYLVAWGADPMPPTANVHFQRGQTTSNTATVKLAPGGLLHLKPTSACHVVVDLQAAGA